MDWNAAIERNGEALKRILAMLVAMAGIIGGPHPEVRAEGEPRRTLPRHLHRAVLRLLRPAEAAARRLVIVAARGLVVDLSPARPRKPKPNPTILRKGVGTGIVMPRNPHPEVRGGAEPRRTLCLPLTDTLPQWRRSRPAARGVPRISFPGLCAPSPVPVRLPLLPDDPIDAARLALRLQAVASVLEDLPRHANRFARWRARRDRLLNRRPESPSPLWGSEGRARQAARPGKVDRFVRLSPLRPGRAPGQHRPGSRRPAHDVDQVLGDLHYFAFHALERPDTS